MAVIKQGNINEANDYSIGVVTYVARFEEFFIPIINQLVSVFPDKEIVCILNGHPDATLQIGYLKKVTAFLAQFPNVRYLSYERHQPLSKAFNWLLMMSFAPRMLILNDDLNLNLLFRADLEKALAENPNFFIINNSWSHFVISKEIVKKIGWFEERLAGTGQEDGDYSVRMQNAGVEIKHAKALGIINYVAPQKNAGWREISAVSKTSGKYSEGNEQFFYKKYSQNGKTKEGYPAYKLNLGMETPLFYDLATLNNDPNFFAAKPNFKNLRPNPFLKLLLPFQWLYSFSRRTGGKIYRFLKAKIS